MQKYKDHPVASLFPLMTGKELIELAGDIKLHGCRAPITLFEGKILDGRNRYRACRIATVEPKFREFTSGDAFAFVISTNLHRRHLTVSQRAMIAAKMAKAEPGRQIKGSNVATFKNTAEALDVSEHSVQSAKKLMKDSPEKVGEVERGEKTITEALRESKREKKSDALLDKSGYPIPEEILKLWNESEEIADFLLSRVSQIKVALETALDSGNLAYAEVTNSTLSKVKYIYQDLKRIEPYAVCTSCQGHPKKCSLCRGRGFISKFSYDSFAPEEIKKIRMAK